MKITKHDKRTKIEREIEREMDSLISELPGCEVISKEYSLILDRVERLNKIRLSDKGNSISPDTLVVVGGNLAGILLILGYERVNIITTKALGFVIKGRV